MHKFKVGDICVICNIDYTLHQKYNGEEVTITSLPGTNSIWKECYGIHGNFDINDCAPFCEEAYLRLKRDDDIERGDMDTIVRWEDCAWRPKVLEVV